MAVNHGQKAGPVASETIIETFKCCPWLRAHITLSITGRPDQGSPPYCRPHCFPYGNLLTSKRCKKLSKFSRLVPFPPLNCGRVTDISITSCTVPFSLNAKILQC